MDPHLISIGSQRYAEAQRKLMVIGQQTHGFGVDRTASDPVGSLVSIERLVGAHLKIGLSGEPHHNRSEFWRATHRLYKLLNPEEPSDAPPDGFLWANLVKVDQQGSKGFGRPDSEVEDTLAEVFPVLPLEVRIAAPDVLVFFTGPGYDERLQATFPGVAYSAVDGYSAETLAALVHPDLPHHAYRTYHPRYLKFKRLGKVIDEIGRIAVDGVARPAGHD